MSSFHNGDPWVSPEFHVELPASDINGVDASGAMLKQTVGKSPRRCAQIEADATGHGDDKLLQRALKLDTPTPHVRMLGGLEHNPRVFRYQGPRFVHHAVIDQHLTGKNKRPGSLAACRQTLCLQGKVQSDPLDSSTCWAVNNRWGHLNRSFDHAEDRVRDVPSPPAHDNELGNRLQRHPAVAKDGHGLLRFRYQSMSPSPRLLDPKQGRERGLLLAEIAPSLLSQDL